MTSSNAPTPPLAWFRQARFGMFIHFGLYADLARGEWVMNQEGMTPEEYAPLAAHFTCDPENIRAWCRLARQAGMRYAVFTTKHHDGFCLWDSPTCPFNSARLGPRRDLTREFVEAARAENLRVGLYYSLADWRHPDGAACDHDEAARQRFVDYTHALVRELCTGYGPLDLLWFDGPWPLKTADRWESPRLLAEIRRLQPTCLVNNRLGIGLDGDFGTPEGHIAAEARMWEACMTFNGDWGYTQTPEDDWRPAREVARMLQTCTAGGGNLLLNIGPASGGNIPQAAIHRLERVGRWLAVHAEACLGPHDPLGDRFPPITNLGFWTLSGHTAWFWLARAYPGPTLAIGGLHGILERATLLHDPHRPLTWEQTPLRTRIHGLPAVNDEPALGIPVLRLDFSSPPSQKFPYPH